MLRRRDPAAPDRAHLHHLLQRRGFTGPQAVLVIVGANTVLGLIGTIGWRAGVPDYVLFGGFVLLGLIYLMLFLYPARFLRLQRRRARPDS
jgi:UDP-GlcNAc:undecaprenyl-phosphate GlcNAc-1-phosphate transferase